MHRLLTHCLLACIAALLFGCNHSPSIVGKWTGTIFDQDVTTEFKDDKSMTASAKLATFSVDFTGTYDMAPKDLTLTIKEAKVKGVDAKEEDKANAAVKGFKGKVFKGTYHFNSDDELAVTYNGKTDLLKRAKESS